MIRVAYWNNIPAPYMVDRFNTVARRGNVDFEAWFSARRESDRSWKVDESEWAFQHRYLPAIDRGDSALAFPAPLLGARAPDVLVSLYAGPGFLLGAELARLRRSRTAFWVEVTFDAWVRRRRWKEALKGRALPRADAILTAGKDGRSFARRYGVHDDRIHEVPHVVDYPRYAASSSLSPDERERVRADLGLRGITFLFVGRLWVGKGLMFLLDAFGELQSQVADELSLLLVGDGRDEELLRSRSEEKGLERVVFVGFRDSDALPRLYAAADVFVFPTLGDPFGMVVLEAMACRLPVIATTSSGEIEDRVTEGVNGFLVPPRDSARLRERMALLARDAGLRQRMGEASAEKVRGQTPDVWAKAFEEAVEKINSQPRIRDSRRRRRLVRPARIGSRLE
jgi:glycosyltransferase involved in cell wall biosynthesis